MLRQPQPVAGPSGSLQHRKRVKRAIINLSDSEDEDRQPVAKRRKRRLHHRDDFVSIGNEIPQAGPSNAVTTPKQPSPFLDLGNAWEDLSLIDTDLFNDPSFHQDQAQTDVPAQKEVLSIDVQLSQVLEIVPDVEPEHALTLLKQYVETYAGGTVERVVGELFENSYPKIVTGKGKRKRDDADDPAVRCTPEIDYRSTDRPYPDTGAYIMLTESHLIEDYPYIPVPFVRKVLASKGNLYVPTYFALRELSNLPVLPYKRKTTRTQLRDKGKFYDASFERELAWLQKEGKEGAKPEAQPPAEDAETEDEECEDGIECACCYCKYEFDKMVQCPEAHLFCRSCVRQYVKTQLGSHDSNIVCMHPSECKLPFPEAELARLLPEKLMDLYHRIKQQKEISDAQIDDLEECPFCEYKAVIENVDEKLFRCQREDCSAVTCRSCKKPDHLPKSCKEAEADRGLDARHKVEEAMSEALMRKCPKERCKKPFIKESGCNKITCSHCGTISCYICRQIITDYSHFDRGGGSGRTTNGKKRCLLWDTPNREQQEVAEARDRAVNDVTLEHPEVERQQLQVDLPQNQRNANANGNGNGNGNGIQRNPYLIPQAHAVMRRAMHDMDLMQAYLGPPPQYPNGPAPEPVLVPPYPARPARPMQANRQPYAVEHLRARDPQQQQGQQQQQPQQQQQAGERNPDPIRERALDNPDMLRQLRGQARALPPIEEYRRRAAVRGPGEELRVQQAQQQELRIQQAVNDLQRRQRQRQQQQRQRAGLPPLDGLVFPNANANVNANVNVNPVGGQGQAGVPVHAQVVANNINNNNNNPPGGPVLQRLPVEWNEGMGWGHWAPPGGPAPVPAPAPAPVAAAAAHVWPGGYAQQNLPGVPAAIPNYAGNAAQAAIQYLRGWGV